MRLIVSEILAGLVLSLTFVRLGAAGQNVPQQPHAIIMRDVLVINRVGSGGGGGGGGGGRVPLSIDAIQASIIAGTWRSPSEGDAVPLSNGDTRTWSRATADERGRLDDRGMRGGYALWTVNMQEPGVMHLAAEGHGMVYVNGEPRMGDPYANGSVILPVALRAGANEFLFHCPRGAIRAELRPVEATVALSPIDATLPDLIAGETGDQWGSLMVVNNTDEQAGPFTLRCEHSGHGAATDEPLFVPAMSVRKLPIRIPPVNVERDDGEKSVRAKVTLIGPSVGDRAQIFPPLEVELKIVDAAALQRRTFRSRIDGSVQYFALRPALKPGPDNAIVLTLHGASVEALGQAAAYSSKDWAHMVAPTNRRPFGFDWEDWGRLDALEVLKIAQRSLPHNPDRLSLTGHSMGGHGTWHLGVTYPGMFAAIAPSAGWISFESYSSLRPPQTPLSPLQNLMRRAANPSRTLELQRNLEDVGVYILHGEADDNVPVNQARTMRQELSTWHQDFAYHEQPGAGHWWGDQCVDWPPLIEFLKQRSRKESNHVRFITSSPGVSAQRDWVTIQQQRSAFEFSSVDLKRDVVESKITGSASNVARLTIDAGAFDATQQPNISIVLDGKAVEATVSPQRATIDLEFDGENWKTAVANVTPSIKTPVRCGPFKAAFNHQFMLVYGTTGTDEENAWSHAKARFDAEQFWYRGNGSNHVIADREFDASDPAIQDCSVILYGHAESNSAWQALLSDSPVQVKRNRVVLGSNEVVGDDLACLFVRPRPGSAVASVAVVSGTGMAGCRATDRLPYFVSGVAYPDCTIIDAGDARIVAAGFFGNDWTVESGEFVFAE